MKQITMTVNSTVYRSRTTYHIVWDLRLVRCLCCGIHIVRVSITRRITGLGGLLLSGSYLGGGVVVVTARGRPSTKASCLDCVGVLTGFMCENIISNTLLTVCGCLSPHADTQTHICLIDIIRSIMSDFPWRTEARPKWPRLTKMSSFQGRLGLVPTRIRVQLTHSLTQILDIDPSSIWPNLTTNQGGDKCTRKSRTAMEGRKAAKNPDMIRPASKDYIHYQLLCLFLHL